jgi:nitrate/TMAO reductase-like tetraheme cytochrome c subunit
MQWMWNRCLILLAMSAAAVTWTGAVRAQEQEADVDNCKVCHAVLDDERLGAPARAFAGDIHAARGLGCADCHGGDRTLAGFEGMDPAKGFVGRPGKQRLASFCGRCHSDAAFMRQFNPSLRVDQVAEYATSVHGRRLTELGDTAVAVCTSCHPAHAIKPPADAASSVHPLNVGATCGACHADPQHMAGYQIPTNQLERYQRSVHWAMMTEAGDLSAPTCNDCHGNHGAAPPGYSWVGNVCGQCHSVIADYFAQSRHAQTFALLGNPGCATCHGNHEILRADAELLGLGEGAVCGQCHVAQDAGGTTATSMRGRLDSLRAAYGGADSLLLRAEHAGMEVSQARFELQGALNALVQARAAVHTFNPARVAAHVDEGLTVTAAAHERGLDALDGLRFRRTGLGVSVTIIVALIVGLLIKIRQAER